MIDIRDHGGVFGGSVGPKVKSIQSGIYFIGPSGLSTNVPINPVKYNNSIVRMHYYYDITYSKSNQLNAVSLAIDLDTSGEFIRFIRNAENAQFWIYWEVIEFESVKSKQVGTFTLNGTNMSIPINPVVPGKTLVFSSHTMTSIDTSSHYIWFTMVGLESPTNLRGRQYSSVYPKDLHYQVIELN